jgi:hypothetical protein
MPAGVLLGVILAQAGTPANPDSAELERIRKSLAAPPTLTTQAHAGEDGRPVFRLSVRGWRFAHAAWHDDTTVPLYVRPSMPPVHFEFLYQVTPEFFRASVLFPGAPSTPYGGVGLGIPLVPVFEKLGKAMKARNRRIAEEAAREDVRHALACRADPRRPGCE